MLLSVLSPRTAAGQSEVDQAFLTAVAGGACEAGNADRNVRFRALECPFGHCPRDDLGDRLIVVEQAWLDAEQFRLRLLAISDEAAIEAVTRALDIGQQRGEHSAGATFGGRHRDAAVA